MMRSPKRNRRLQFEVMESREVLSANPAGAPLASSILISPPPVPHPLPHEVVLNGLLSGSYSAIDPLQQTSFDLSGQGQVQPFGQMNVTGTLYSPGSILKGHASGTLTLSDSQGTLTLQLTSPVLDPLPGPLHPITQRGFSPLPKLFGFEITGGTGAFANVTGRGTAFLQLVAEESLWGQLGHFDLSLVGGFNPLPPQSQTQ